MPEQKFIVPIPGIQINSSQETSFGVFLKCSLTTTKFECPSCQSLVVKLKAYRVRELKHGFWAQKLIHLHLKVPKLKCLSCSRYFMARVPGVLPKKRASEQFRREVFHQHQGGQTLTHVSVTYKISASTVERWYQDYVAYRVKELEGRNCPIVLGIDEHFFTKKRGYATTLVDLRNHKVFDVVLGRDERSLGAYLSRLPGREQVQVVCMDMSETYRRLVKKYFPNAKIVADRFHVIRWINHQFLNSWKEVDPDSRSNRGLLKLIRKHSWNLHEDQKAELDKYFCRQPIIKSIYEFKSGLTELLLKKHQNKFQVKDLIPQLMWHIEQCKQSPFRAFNELAKTLKRWLEPIACMWRFTKNNGITEGLHNKMEMLSRRAFGFRNFQNYRLRVIALCGWNGVFELRN